MLRHSSRSRPLRLSAKPIFNRPSGTNEAEPHFVVHNPAFQLPAGKLPSIITSYAGGHVTTLCPCFGESDGDFYAGHSAVSLSHTHSRVN